MTDSNPDVDVVCLDHENAEALWQAWAPSGEEDVLARAAFERELRILAGLNADGLYFRPGGWSVNLTATAARIACAAAFLAAGFQIAGLEDLDREVIVATASLVAAMDVRPVRLRRGDHRLADALRQNGLAGVAVSADAARGALPRGRRREVSADEVADALDRLVAAGMADRESDDEWVVRPPGSEAWLRVSLHGWDS